MPHRDQLCRRVAYALKAAHGLALPVLFTEQVPDKLGNTEETLRACAPDAPVYAKDTFSALAEPTILAALESKPLPHLHILGIETPICVYQTARDAHSRGMEVTVLSDAIDARRNGDAKACLEELARLGVHVLPAEAVFYSILGNARHPFFKIHTQLVKSHA